MTRLYDIDGLSSETERRNLRTFTLHETLT